MSDMEEKVEAPVKVKSPPLYNLSAVFYFLVC